MLRSVEPVIRAEDRERSREFDDERYPERLACEHGVDPEASGARMEPHPGNVHEAVRDSLERVESLGTNNVPGKEQRNLATNQKERNRDNDAGEDVQCERDAPNKRDEQSDSDGKHQGREMGERRQMGTERWAGEWREIEEGRTLSASTRGTMDGRARAAQWRVAEENSQWSQLKSGSRLSN
jgi:hypothetical protein